MIPALGGRDKARADRSACHLSDLIQRGRYKEALRSGELADSGRSNPYRPVPNDGAASAIVVHAEDRVGSAIEKQGACLKARQVIGNSGLDITDSEPNLGNVIHPTAVITGVGGIVMLGFACFGAAAMGSELALAIGGMGLISVLSSAVHVGRKLLSFIAGCHIRSAKNILNKLGELAETASDASAKVTLECGTDQITGLLTATR